MPIMAHSLLNRLKSKREREQNVKETGGKYARSRLQQQNQVAGRNAAEMVLSMYELLENILLFLPPTQLRKAQRVCRLWNDIILRSSLLKSITTHDLTPGARRVNVRLLGGRGVGKRCLAMNWDKHAMSRSHQPYGGTWPAQKQMTIEGEVWDTRIEWDSNGALEQFIRLPYQSHAYALVYSVTSRTSFERVRTFYDFVTTLSSSAIERAASLAESPQQQRHQHRNTNPSPQPPPPPPPLMLSKPIALIANKCDFHSLLHGWDVDREEGLALAESLGCPFYETSAKSRDGVDEALNAMMHSYKSLALERLAERREENKPAPAVAAPIVKKRRADVVASLWRRTRRRSMHPWSREVDTAA